MRKPTLTESKEGILPQRTLPPWWAFLRTDHSSASMDITNMLNHGLVEVQAGQQWVVFSCFPADFPQAAPRCLYIDFKVHLSGISEGEAQ